MRIARYDGGRTGVVSGDRIVDIASVCGIDPRVWPPVGATQLIAEFRRFRPIIDSCLASEQGKPLREAVLETPIPWPNKIIAYPVNYHAHGREMKATYRASSQGFFLKPNSALSGPCDPIVLPRVPGREVHHECELAVIIGKQVRGVSRREAMACVFGYSCLLDMVVRGREERVFRKAFDTFCPVGPWLTTADEVGDPSSLRLRLWVDDHLRQDANTRDLVLDIPGMIEMAAAVMTLYPGDIIATGTPEGVGPVHAGNRVRIEIERVGEMTLNVVQGEQGVPAVFDEPYKVQLAKA